MLSHNLSNETTKQIASKGAKSASHHMRKLLITTNAKDDMDIVVKRGAALVHALKANASVLHVVDPDLSPIDMEQRRLIINNAIRDHFPTDKPMPDVRITAYPFHADDTDFGRAEIIKTLSEESGADLILIGEKRASSLFRNLRGTLTIQTLSQANAPVLICTDKLAQPYMNLCVATDLQGGHTRKARSILALAPAAKMSFVHIYPDKSAGVESDFSTADAIDKFLSGIDCDITKHKIAKFFATGQARMLVGSANRPSKELPNFIKELTPDLLVFATRAHRGFERIIHGSVAQSFIQNPVCDVLALRKSTAISQ